MWPGAGHGVFTSALASGGAFGTSTTSCCDELDVVDVVPLTVAQPNESNENERAMERVMFMAGEHEQDACHARRGARSASIGRLREKVQPRGGQYTPAYKCK